MKVKTCLMCQGHSPKHKPEVIIHEPDCSEGRCAASHNSGEWPWTARCIKFGQDAHGEKHEDKHGNHWQGMWRSVAEGPSCEETIHSFPMYAQMETNGKGTQWVIRTRQEVVICRSPERYEDADAARESLRRFMDTVNMEGPRG